MKKIFLLIFSISSILSTLRAQESITYAFTIDEAVNYALTNNYSVRTAKLDIDAAVKKKWETTTIGLPQINGKVDYQNWLKQGITLIPGEFFGGEPGEFMEVTFGTKQNLNATLTLTQLLFDGSYLVGLQSAKTYLKISELAKEKTDQKEPIEKILEPVPQLSPEEMDKEPLKFESPQIIEKEKTSGNHGKIKDENIPIFTRRENMVNYRKSDK